jgi:hypothetical protein
VVEDLGLARLGRGDEVRVQNAEDVLADLGELALNLLAVLLDEANLGGVALGLLLLLNRGDDSPRRTASTNDVLVGNRQKVPLLDSKIAVLRGDNLHVLNHLCVRGGASVSIRLGRRHSGIHALIALGLLGQLGQVDCIFVTHVGEWTGICEMEVSGKSCGWWGELVR